MKPEIKVSDHAVLRFMQQLMGTDIQALHQQIAQSLDPLTLRREIEFAGNTPFRYKNNGITYCLRGKTVTTCYPSKKIIYGNQQWT